MLTRAGRLYGTSSRGGVTVTAKPVTSPDCLPRAATRRGRRCEGFTVPPASPRGGRQERRPFREPPFGAVASCKSRPRWRPVPSPARARDGQRRFGHGRSPPLGPRTGRTRRNFFSKRRARTRSQGREGGLVRRPPSISVSARALGEGALRRHRRDAPGRSAATPRVGRAVRTLGPGGGRPPDSHSPTSDQARLPARFKHISKRRKRN